MFCQQSAEPIFSTWPDQVLQAYIASEGAMEYSNANRALLTKQFYFLTLSTNHPPGSDNNTDTLLSEGIKTLNYTPTRWSVYLACLRTFLVVNSTPAPSFIWGVSKLCLGGVFTFEGSCPGAQECFDHRSLGRFSPLPPYALVRKAHKMNVDKMAKHMILVIRVLQQTHH